MKAARALRYARRRAGLTQRELGDRTGVPQSTIARIESGAVDPRTGTLSRLLRACGFDLEVEPRLGLGVDRSQVGDYLQASPVDRVRHLTQDARVLAQLDAARKVG
jgi:predicted transcriptional regulator